MLQIFGVRIDSLTREELLQTLRSWLRTETGKSIATPNAEMILRAREHPSFVEALNTSSLSLPDTVSLEYAGLAYGEPLAGRHAGVNTLKDLAELCMQEGKSMLLFGGDPGSAKAAAENLRKQFAYLQIHHLDPGHIEMLREGEVDLHDALLDQIRSYEPDVVALALGAGKQEYAMHELLKKIPDVRIALGVGGAFEMIGGIRPRAPEWMQRRGLEWLWRLKLEPTRIGRIYNAAVAFPILIAFDTLRKRRFTEACRAVFPKIFNTSKPSQTETRSHSMTVRTRIAPSPTGYVHIGTLRTALFNYFLARQNNGKYLIRIEDTDRERMVEGAVENLLQVMAQIGLEHDEGPFLDDDGVLMEKGEHGPYTQSQRLEIYREHVQKLIDDGNAYYCFCTKERLDEMRKAQQATKQTPKYDRTCCKLGEDEIKAKMDAGEAHVVRLKVPEGETIVEDIIRGNVKFQNKEIDDQVILKSDGFPTYHLAVVVDDYLMNITHVIRGEEWLPSTPKHVLLHKMLGFDLPQYAHVPLLLNPDKSKLSKRQGDVAVEDYLKRGYLAEALINFVGTLGFNPKGDEEIYTLQELIDQFDLAKVNKAGAVMNMEKLDWINNHYIRQLSEEELASVAQSFVQADVDSPSIRRAMMVERERISRLDELNERLEMYVMEPAYDPNMLVWKKADAADAKKNLSGVLEVINSLSDDDFSSAEALEKGIRTYIEHNDLQNGNVLWPLRVALSGKEKSSSPFELLWALGKEQGSARIEKAISIL